MKLLLILFVVLKADLSVAQERLILDGRWKIIAITQVIYTSRDSLYYDLNKDSMHIPPEDLREASKDGLDSIQTVNLFKSMYESYKNSTISFAKDSVFLNFRSDNAKGTYQMKGNETLEMRLVIEKQQQEPVTYIYLLTGDLLSLLRKEDSGCTRFFLKRQ